MYQLQLFTDINDVFTNKYLHKVDSDTILISEVHKIAHQTCENLQTISTPKADHLLDNLDVDEFGNISAQFDLHGTTHTIRLNESIARRGRLANIKFPVLQAYRNQNSTTTYIPMILILPIIINSIISYSGASLENSKEKARTLKTEIIQVMVTNIEDQNRPDSVAGVFSCLDLSTDESKEDREEKLSAIHDLYGHIMYKTNENKW